MIRRPGRLEADARTVGTMASLILFSFGTHCILRGIVLPAIKEDFGLTYTEMSAVVSISSVGYLLMAMFSTKLSERMGQKNVLSLLAAVISATALLIAASSSYWQLAVLFLLAGCSYGGIECVVTAIVRRYHPLDADRSVNNVYGFYSVGSLFIAIAGGWMMQRGIGWRAAYLFVAAAAAGAFAYSLRIRDSSAGAAPRVELSELGPLLRDRVFLVMSLSTALLSGAEAASINWMNTFLAETVEDMNIFQSSCTTALFFACIYLGRLVISRLMNRFRSVTLTIACCFATGVIVMLVSFVSTPLLMLAGIALFGFFVSCLYPLLVSITNGLSPGNLTYPFSFTVISVMNFSVNYLMGVVADAYDLPSTFRFCAVLYLAVAAAVLLCRRSVLEREAVRT